jgi:hypothetical protein
LRLSDEKKKSLRFNGQSKAEQFLFTVTLHSRCISSEQYGNSEQLGQRNSTSEVGSAGFVVRRPLKIFLFAFKERVCLKRQKGIALQMF